jgi:hypothetical protein
MPDYISVRDNFWALIDFHLQRGTRPAPNRGPSLVGPVWSNKEFSYKCGVNQRTVLYWRQTNPDKRRTVPPVLTPVESAFFGDNEAYDVCDSSGRSWRSDLRSAYFDAKKSQSDAIPEHVSDNSRDLSNMSERQDFAKINHAPAAGRFSETAVLTSVEAELAQQWLCDFLRLTKNTVLIYSDSLGRDLIGRSDIPVVHPQRSKNFAYLMRDLFTRITGFELKISGFSALSDEERDSIEHQPDLAILGSEMSNDLFRKMFGDLRVPGKIGNGFRHTNRRWRAKLAVTLATHPFKEAKESYWLPEGRDLKEPWRGYKLDNWNDFEFPDASFDEPLGDFIISKLQSPIGIDPPEKVLSINGIHGRGAIAARQLFEFAKRPGDMKVEAQLIEKIMGLVPKMGSWQVIVRAYDYDAQNTHRFTAMKVMGYAQVITQT